MPEIASYNITLNQDDTTPIENTPLMDGLNGESSNGTNQQIKAKDAVFTLLAFANDLTNSDSLTYEWLSDCYVDKENPFSFHIEIDANPLTPEIEPYPEAQAKIAVPILPEFFLNSTSDSISYTDGGIRCWGLYPGITNTPQWTGYSKSAFSCGKYQLYYTNENSVSVLQRNNLWHGFGGIDDSPERQPFVERINIKCIPDSMEALNEFKQGKLELMSVTEFVEERKLMQDDPRFEVQSIISDFYSFLGFNLTSSKIGGPSNLEFLNKTGKEEYTRACAVRKAICYAIDREEMNQVIHDGEYSLVHKPVYLISFYYYDSGIKYYHDLDSAWEWMEAAGYIKPSTRQTFTLGSESSISILLISLATSSLIFKLKRRRK